MRLLALDTSADHCSVALCDGGRWHGQSVLAGHTHSQRILPMVHDALAQAGLSLRQLDGLAFGAGPGSFTGLRIACGVVQGLAFGAALPVVPVSTLEAMAQACGAEKIIACIDARMDEVYHAAYVRRDDGTLDCVSEPGVYGPGDVPRLAGSGWVGVGNGYTAYPGLPRVYGDRLDAVRAEIMPTARAVAMLALPRLAAGVCVAAADASPVYVRSKVAFTTAEREGVAS
jgi:tRNA threonylcarbamoyladenosine biosynthesis protein TsaB